MDAEESLPSDFPIRIRCSPPAPPAAAPAMARTAEPQPTLDTDSRARAFVHEPYSSTGWAASSVEQNLLRERHLVWEDREQGSRVYARM